MGISFGAHKLCSTLINMGHYDTIRDIMTALHIYLLCVRYITKELLLMLMRIVMSEQSCKEKKQDKC